MHCIIDNKVSKIQKEKNKCETACLISHVKTSCNNTKKAEKSNNSESNPEHNNKECKESTSIQVKTH